MQKSLPDRRGDRAGGRKQEAGAGAGRFNLGIEQTAGADGRRQEQAADGRSRSYRLRQRAAPTDMKPS